MRVLVVEDQSPLRDSIVRRLRALGYAADEAPDCGSAEAFIASYRYDVVILDRLLPDGDALPMLQQWRRRGIATPTLFLTACDQVPDRVNGLASGADDYLVKPFAMEELMARVAAIGRRGPATVPSILRVGDLEIDAGRREVRRAGILLTLRPKEFAVLQLLAECGGTVVSHRTIIARCWGEGDEPTSNAEEVIIGALRRKLGQPTMLHTVRGAGYLLEAVDAAARP
ncbi:response regulator [Trinickia fusca]|uniref:DNA-binding response regulator n=1 Tax=Trinickia fusca TaxID=2419777 RepID=A0A494X790_9BURK|nr:response regulator transcription factor [Trinickia fusca]RKP43869.1 DNA-binding response regulator [Trinickia fusca]